MQKTIRFLTIVFLLLLSSTPGYPAEQPLAVSPGLGDGIATINQSTPTFSWSKSDDSVAYRLVIFVVISGNVGEVLSFSEMEAQAEPVLDMTFPAPVFSWTPSLNDRLCADTIYIWFVQAIDREGFGIWSDGRRFTISLKRTSLPLETALQDEPPSNRHKPAADMHSLNSTATSFDDNPESFISTADLDTSQLRTGGSENGSNTLYGYESGQSLTSGTYNTFIGYMAGSTSAAAYNNAFLGALSGNRNETGGYNVFLGVESGCYNSDGEHNTAVGYRAGYWNNHGDDNTFLGYGAGRNTRPYIGAPDDSASDNTFIGVLAGYNNSHGSLNSFFGKDSGYQCNTGEKNTFVGAQAGYKCEHGDTNVAIGYGSGYSLQGNNNVCIGYYAGAVNEGGGNIFIGSEAGYWDQTGENRLYIANSDTGLPLIYGEFDHHLLKIHGQLQMLSSVSASDRRLKKEIQPLASCLPRVLQLQGVRYHWGKEKYPDWGFDDKAHLGLIAQEVEPLLPELVTTDEQGYKAVAYTELSAVLVEAIKELNSEREKDHNQLTAQRATVEKQRLALQEQQQRLDQLQQQLEALKDLVKKHRDPQD
ncbi:MAG: tail fiber domain-containing protein [Desulfuromonadales bacterium]|nr:tail fiber domain-containing protein [Desulfuromonadales bacterium]